MLERLLSLYDQICTARRQPYGRFINLYRESGIAVAVKEVQEWKSRCEKASAAGNELMANDVAISGCILNILLDVSNGRNN